ncbi:hypothetical protein EMIHUDRAFT_242839 [Emiliania huxleyi CCMP1516]|uniref:Chloride channel protein n=2 Tax=Emiliania huxleyi TaxID=2903 RepID=A0A0D3J7C1_EMIH1|nr:hypothetical protein EMIHUDRAFT_242839 [Emiliania huxleyi CCMP1516]EOD19406.1 hypothetical protein EMIHUDRAFT_242839 [Emiliania huxleyi CCMP1516]|eukprot:XP_005771835.1 hypothetical protein EMIHUDRAFT_242839 [Emiliania huxleyi CCMP1516]
MAAADPIEETPRRLAAFGVYVSINTGFVLVAALLTVWAPQARGSGLPALKAYLNGVHQRKQWASLPALVAKSIGITLVVATALPLGKEGPMVHIGAMVGAVVSRSKVCGLERFLELRLPRPQREWVGMGAAAGVAAAFNAPLGGILYSFEEVCSSWSANLTWRSFICSVVVVTTLSLFIHFVPLMHSEGFVLGLGSSSHGPSPPINSLAFVWMALLSLAGGILGALYNDLVVRINRRRNSLRLGPFGRVAEVVLLSVAVFSVYFWLPVATACEPCPPSSEAVSCGSGGAHSDDAHASITLHGFDCAAGHYSPMATLMHSGQEGVIKHLLSRHPSATPPFPPLTLGLVLAVYYLLAIASMGIAVPAGNFVPGIIIGGVLGRLTGEVLAGAKVPGSGATDFPGVMALVGATAVLGGMTRMTLTIAVILTEITDDVHLLPTIMLALAISKAIGDRISPSFDDGMIRLMRLPMLEDAPPAVLEPLVARDVMAGPVLTLKEQLLVGDVVQILASNNHNGFPVVGVGGHIVGMLERRQLLVLLQERVWTIGTWALTARTRMRFITSQDGSETAGSRGSRRAGGAVHALLALDPREKERQIDLRPFMDPSPILVGELTPLPRVYRMFNEIGVRHLPVVDKMKRVSGIITRKDLQHESVEKRLEEFWMSKRGGRWACEDSHAAQPSPVGDPQSPRARVVAADTSDEEVEMLQPSNREAEQARLLSCLTADEGDGRKLSSAPASCQPTPQRRAPAPI